MRTRKGVLPLLAALFSAFCLSVAAVAQTIPNGAAIDAEVSKIMIRTHAKGMAVAVIDHGQVSHVHAYGIRNVKGDPLTPDTVMYGASLTKTVLAYTVMQLVDQDKLNLDTPIKEDLEKPLPSYGPDPVFPDKYGPYKDLADNSRWQKITPRMLSLAKTPSARKPLIIWPVYSTLLLMIETLRWLGILTIAAFRDRRDLALENLVFSFFSGFQIFLSAARRATSLIDAERELGGRLGGFSCCFFLHHDSEEPRQFLLVAPQNSLTPGLGGLEQLPGFMIDDFANKAGDLHTAQDEKEFGLLVQAHRRPVKSRRHMLAHGRPIWTRTRELDLTGRWKKSCAFCQKHFFQIRRKFS
jgi:beta-lactamase family protein